VREKGARNHFAARGGELVHLVFSVCLVCLGHLAGKRTKQDKLDKIAKITGRARPNHSTFTIQH
jgi:hypothetical protein